MHCKYMYIKILIVTNQCIVQPYLFVLPLIYFKVKLLLPATNLYKLQKAQKVANINFLPISADRTARLWDVDYAQCLLKYLGHSGSGRD